MTVADWEVRLSSAAEADFREIVSWTSRQFGGRRAVAYGQVLGNALDALEAGPNIIGVRKRDDIGTGYCTLHVARNRSSGRHFILSRLSDPAGEQIIRVVRILHDAMDPTRHLPAEDQD